MNSFISYGSRSQKGVSHQIMYQLKAIVDFGKRVIQRFRGITEDYGGLMGSPRAGHVGINTDYKPGSTS